jgi:hypothetical protein
MKKVTTSILTLAAVGVLGVTAATAAPVLVENFSYATPSGLVGQGGWATHSGGGTNAQTVNAGNLTYPGYPSSGVGALLGTLAASGEDTNRSFTGITTGTAYLAALVNVASTTTTGDYFLHFADGAIGGNIFLGRLFVKKDAASTNYAFGIQFGSTVATVYTPFSYAPGTTHLVVIKYTFNAGTQNDVASLFIDPVADCVEPAPNVTHSNPGGTQADGANLDFVCVRQGGAASGGTMQVDGIRVANNWTDATCDPATPSKSSTWGQVKVLYR